MESGSVHVARRLFRSYASAHAIGVVAVKRSKDDKEYFVQDWVEERAAEARCEVEAQGRNKYPDFWLSLDGTTIGNEVKSLAHHPNGRPARKDLDFNSTAPQSLMQGRDCFLTFVLYRHDSLDSPLQGTVTTVCLADIAFLNADKNFVPLNLSVKKFGSYGDGIIRNRRMYRFRHPVTVLDEIGLDIRGRPTLILPEGSLGQAEALADRLLQIGSVERATAPQRLASYLVNVRTGEIEPRFTEAKQQLLHRFEVWTPVASRS